MSPTYTPAPVSDRPRRFGALLGDSLRRPGGRRVASLLSAVLFVAGIGMFAYPAITDLNQHNLQKKLEKQFDTPQIAQLYREHKIKVGQGLTRLRIPKLHVDVLVVEGVTLAALQAGAGHYPETPLPCTAGNVGIAGHRTTYGRPFNQLDEMRPGDEVILDTPIQECVYKVSNAFGGHQNPWVVEPTDFSVVSQVAGHWLTLTTCHPKGSASHRLILRLQMVSVRNLPLKHS